MKHVILVDKVEWYIIDAVNFVVERNGRKARIVWKNGIAKLFQRNILNGRFRSQRVAVQ